MNIHHSNGLLCPVVSSDLLKRALLGTFDKTTLLYMHILLQPFLQQLSHCVPSGTRTPASVRCECKCLHGDQYVKDGVSLFQFDFNVFVCPLNVFMMEATLPPVCKRRCSLRDHVTSWRPACVFMMEAMPPPVCQRRCSL